MDKCICLFDNISLVYNFIKGDVYMYSKFLGKTYAPGIVLYNVQVSDRTFCFNDSEFEKYFKPLQEYRNNIIDELI